MGCYRYALAARRYEMTTATGIRLKNIFAIIPMLSSATAFAPNVPEDFIRSFTKRAVQKSADSKVLSANKSPDQRSRGIEEAGLTGDVAKTEGAVKTDELLNDSGVLCIKCLFRVKN